MGRCLGVLLACFSLSLPAMAHVGSPDVYADGQAGPYRLLVTVRPPQVIPGVAEIEVRAPGTDIRDIEIAPIPLTGEASKHPPVADAMRRADQGTSKDAHFFTGALWIMASGSWQVRFTVNGAQGTGVVSIPVPATSSKTLGMPLPMGAMLAGLGSLLVLGVVGIVGAAVRDARLPAGATPTGTGKKQARLAMAAALVLMAGAILLGRWWWAAEAASYARYVYKPLTMDAALTYSPASASGTAAWPAKLTLKITDPGWLKSRKVDDFVLDHDHLMHLYLLREPGLDVVYHLHPDLVAPGQFTLELPDMPAGTYRMYADVVHATGFPETLVSSITLPPVPGRPLAGDDARGTAPALRKEEGSCGAAPAASTRFQLPDGYTMVRSNAENLPAKTPQIFAFELLDPTGKPPADMALYMGMLGHAAFVKTDGSVFAHVHPSGTVSMAALMMAAAQNGTQGSQSNPMDSMPTMKAAVSIKTNHGGLPNSVGFPYGFPTAGAYRIFVQMKHGSTVETGSFDACAQ